MGVLLIVAVIVAALFTSGLAGAIVDGTRSAICSIAQVACADDEPRDRPPREQRPPRQPATVSSSA
jgi:hypothetical protein